MLEKATADVQINVTHEDHQHYYIQKNSGPIGLVLVSQSPTLAKTGDIQYIDKFQTPDSSSPLSILGQLPTKNYCGVDTY